MTEPTRPDQPSETPAVPWDDSPTSWADPTTGDVPEAAPPAEAAEAPSDVTQRIPEAHDGATRALPSEPGPVPPRSPWRTPAEATRPMAVPPPYLPPAGRPAVPPRATPPPGGPSYPPGFPPPGAQPPGAFAPYAAAPYGAPPPRRGRRILWLVLGGVVVLAAIAAGVFALLTRGPEVGQLYAQCEGGDAQACEDLFQAADAGSAEEEFGRTCGGRTDGSVDCADADMTAPPNSWSASGGEGEADIAALYSACEAGDGAACDQLFSAAEPGSAEEEFGRTCGGRSDGATFCDGADFMGEPPNSWEPSTTIGEATTYGDDPYLDGLWDACAGGDMVACDDLFMESPFGSEYEEFGDTCGGTTSGGEWCDPNREP